MNEHERLTAARRERNAADDRRLAAEQGFGEYAALTYPRPNEQADGALEQVRRAENDVAYWGGAVAALTGKLPIDEAYPFGKRESLIGADGGIKPARDWQPDDAPESAGVAQCSGYCQPDDECLCGDACI